MGMDVYGKAPTAPEGEYFRRNALNWGLLVDCVTTLCPEEAAACKGWNYNSGDGLNADGAAALAAKLEALRDSGDVAAYCAARDAWADQAFYGGSGFGPASRQMIAGCGQYRRAIACRKKDRRLRVRREPPLDLQAAIDRARSAAYPGREAAAINEMIRTFQQKVARSA